MRGRWHGRALSATIALALLACFPASAGAGTLRWSAPIRLDHQGGNGQSLTGVSCPSATECVAVDDSGQQVLFNPKSPGKSRATTIDPGYQLIAVSCPITSQCSAVDNSGRELTFNPFFPGIRARLPSTSAGTSMRWRALRRGGVWPSTASGTRLRSTRTCTRSQGLNRASIQATS